MYICHSVTASYVSNNKKYNRQLYKKRGRMRFEYSCRFYFMIGIYKLQNPKGEVYIGSSSMIEKRILHYKRVNCKMQTKLYNSLIEYGWDKHKFEVIEECDILNLKERERFWQEHYDVLNKGLNLQYTKTSTKKSIFSETTKKRISDSLKGKIPHNKGVPLTKESIIKRTDKQAFVYINLDTFIFYSFKELISYYNTKPTTLRRKINNKKINVIKI